MLSKHHTWISGITCPSPSYVNVVVGLGRGFKTTRKPCMPGHTDMQCLCSIDTYRVISSTSYALSMTCLTADTTTESNRRDRPDFLVSRSNATRNSCHVYHDVMSYIVINCRTRGCANRSIGQHTREFKCTATVTATVSSITEEYRTNQFAEAGVKSKKSHSMIKQLFQIGEHHSGALLDSV